MLCLTRTLKIIKYGSIIATRGRVLVMYKIIGSSAMVSQINKGRDSVQSACGLPPATPSATGWASLWPLSSTFVKGTTWRNYISILYAAYKPWGRNL
jgi:hypothetical protein